MGVMRHVPTPDPDQSLERRLSAYLSRRGRTARRSQPDASDASRRVLRSAAKGRLHLDEEALTHVAAALGDELSELTAPRAPLTLVTEGLAIGGHRQGFRRGQSRAALVAYLELLDAVARGAADPTPILRSDIGLLEGLVGVDAVALIHRVGHHFDLARDTREAMVRLHRRRADVIGFRWPQDRAADGAPDHLNWPTQPGHRVPALAAAPAAGGTEAGRAVPAHWWGERGVRPASGHRA